MMRIRGGIAGRLRFLDGLRFADFEFSLALVGGFDGVGTRPHAGFLKEIAPAFVPVGGILGLFKLLYLGFCVLFAFEYTDNARRPEGADVVADDSVGSAGFVACQRESMYDRRIVCQKPEKAISAWKSPSESMRRPRPPARFLPASPWDPW